MKKSLSILLFCLIALSLSAQENRRTAVVPFNAVGVSENEAMIITGLFETALVNTKSFSVIEQSQIADIMEAQAYSLGGCTDESCAIEVGKLLSAEQIILGDLSSIGGKIILNAKIIDVEKGFNIKADNVEASGIGEMTTAVELLAYKLAGLTFTSGGNVQVAQSFGEVLIETNPSGADIFINGVKKGVSPDLISRIPLGTINIEAKKGNLYGVKNVTVSKETSMIRLSLKEQYGNIFIKSSEKSVEVYLDGRRLGPLGSGFFDNIAVGNHSLELKGDSVSWKEEVKVEPGSSTKIEAYPRGFGFLDYNIAEGAQAEVSGNDFNRILMGSGSLQLNTGNFGVSITGSIYKSEVERITITKGGRSSLSPKMEFTSAHALKLENDRKTSLYASLDTELSELENNISPDNIIQSDDTSKISDLGRRISSAEFSFQDLSDRWTILNSRAEDIKELHDLIAKKIELDLQLSLLKDSQNEHSVNGWILLGAGAASAVLSVTSFILSWTTYQNYLLAGAEDWQNLKEQYQTWDLIGYISAGTAAAGGGLAPILWMTSPPEDKVAGTAARLASITSELSRAQTKLK
jgi:TolB-like protein